jgi:hypothetical protein
MTFLKKIQNLPKNQRQLILYFSLGLIVFLLLIWQYFWFKKTLTLEFDLRQKFLNDLKVPQLQKEIERKNQGAIFQKEDLEKMEKEIQEFIKNQKKESAQ